MNCKIEGCRRPRRRQGWCDAHYKQWKRFGDPLAADNRRDKKAAATLAAATPEERKRLEYLHSLRNSFETARRKRGIPAHGTMPNQPQEART